MPFRRKPYDPQNSLRDGGFAVPDGDFEPTLMAAGLSAWENQRSGAVTRGLHIYGGVHARPPLQAKHWVGIRHALIDGLTALDFVVMRPGDHLPDVDLVRSKMRERLQRNDARAWRSLALFRAISSGAVFFVPGPMQQRITSAPQGFQSAVSRSRLPLHSVAMLQTSLPVTLNDPMEDAARGAADDALEEVARSLSHFELHRAVGDKSPEAGRKQVVTNVPGYSADADVSIVGLVFTADDKGKMTDDAGLICLVDVSLEPQKGARLPVSGATIASIAPVNIARSKSRETLRAFAATVSHNAERGRPGGDITIIKSLPDLGGGGTRGLS